MAQVSQALNKGKLEQQDFKIIQENAAPVLAIMAERFGTVDKNAILANHSVKEFMDTVTQGLIDQGGGPATLANEWDNFREVVRLAMRDLGEAIAQNGKLVEMLQKVQKWIRQAVDWFTNLDEKTQRNILAVAGLAAAIGPLAIVLGNIILLFGQFAGALAVLAGPVGWITLAVAAIVALELAMRDLEASLEEMPDKTRKWVEPLIGVYKWLKKISAVITRLVVGLATLGASEVWRMIKNGREPMGGKGPQNKSNNVGGRARFLQPKGPPVDSGNSDYDEEKAFELWEQESDLHGAMTGLTGLNPRIFGHLATTRGINAGKFGGRGVGLRGGGPMFGKKDQSGFRGMRPDSGRPAQQSFGERLADPDSQLNHNIQKAQETLGIVQDATAQLNQVLVSGIQTRLDELENYYRREQALILASQMSEEQKQKALQKLNEKTEKQRTRLQKQRAKREKAIAVFNGILLGAQAVLKALSIGGLILAGIVGGLAAVQTGIIAGAPLPLAEGAMIHGNTYANIGEYIGARNNPEVVAPLDKLKNIIADSGMMGGYPRVQLVMRGNDWYAAFEDLNRSRASNGGPYFEQSF
jgi:hypothetical protein